MDYGPLVMEEIAAGATLAQEFDQYAPVKAAFWLKASDEDQRYLYLASERFDDGTVGPAYQEILRLLKKIRSPFIDPFRIKLIGGKSPLAIAASDANVRPSGTMPTRLGGLPADDVYVYPAPVSTST